MIRNMRIIFLSGARPPLSRPCGSMSAFELLNHKPDRALLASCSVCGELGHDTEECARATRDTTAAEDAALEEHGRAILLTRPRYMYDADGRDVDMNAIFEHATSGAKCYVGNISAAQNKRLLLEHGITRVVNCQGARTRNHHEADARFECVISVSD